MKTDTPVLTINPYIGVLITGIFNLLQAPITYVVWSV
jgi:hypothetical protein